MKVLIPIFIFFTILSCKTKETSLMSNLSNKSELKINDCPKGITCTVEVLKNKTYTIETDSMDKIYPKIVDGEDIVIKYTYSVDNPNNYADGNQSETLHFIITKDLETTFKDKELQKVKLLFGKNCFCRDIFGFYKVEIGAFNITKSNSKSIIDIEFTIPKLGERQFSKKVHLILE